MRLCSICREPGHRKETCTRRNHEPAEKPERVTSGPDYNKPIDEDLVQDIIRMKQEENMRPQAIAIETGLSISTVLRTLSRNGVSHRVKRKIDRDPLTRSQYNDVRTSKEHGMTSGAAAELMRVDLAEVNAAWAVTSFERYLEER